MFGEWEDTPEDAEKTASSLKDQETTLKSIEKLVNSRNNKTQEILKMEREIANMHGDSMAQMEAELAIVKELRDRKEEMANKASEYSEEQKAALIEEINGLEELVESIKLTGETADEMFERLRGATSGLAKEGSKAGQQFFGGIASKLGLASKAGGNWIAKLNEMGKKMKNPQFAANFKKSFKEIFSLQNMVASGMVMVLQATLKMAMAAEKAAAAFSKATGTGRKFADRLTDLAQNNRALGITFGEFGASQKSAMQNFSGFGLMTEQAQDKLTKFGAVMEKNGVSTDTTMQQLELYTKGLGMSQQAAMDYATELNTMATALGMTASDMAKLNKEGMKSLNAFGRGAKKVFADTLAMAKGLGVEMSDLLSFAEGFQTFEDSAKNVTSLNAVLGTTMSSMEMMAAEAQGGPAAAMEMMLKNFRKHGVQYDKLDIYTKRAVAHSMGIKDMDKAARMFGGDLSGFRKYQKEQEQAAKKQEDMEKKAQAAMDIQQQFTFALQEFATELKPVINAITLIVKGFAKLAHAMGPTMTSAVFLLVGAFATMVMMAPGIVAMFGSTAASSGGAATGVTTFGGAVTNASPGLFVFGQGMLMVGFGLLMAGAAIALVVLSFVLLVTAITDLAVSGGEAAAAMIGVGIAIYIMSGALALLATIGAPGAAIVIGLAYAFGFLALGVAAAGLGIAAAFLSMESFIESDSDLIKIAESLDVLAGAMTRLNMAMSGQGLLSRGLNAMTGGLFGAIFGGGAPKKTPIQQMVEDLQPLIDNADTLSTIFGGLEGALNADLGKTMEDLGSGLLKIGTIMNDGEKAVAVSHTLENLALVTTGTSAGTQTGFGAVIKALSGMGEKGMNITLKLDADAVKKLAEDGFFQGLAET